MNTLSFFIVTLILLIFIRKYISSILLSRLIGLIFLYLGLLIYNYMYFYLIRFNIGVVSILHFSFIYFIFVDYMIKHGIFNLYFPDVKFNYISLTKLSYYNLKFTLIIFILIGLLIISLFDFNIIYSISDLNYDLSYFDTPNKDSGQINNSISGNVKEGNINTPTVNVTIPNAVAGTISAAAGGALALKVANSIPGSPTVKMAAAAGTMAATQLISTGMTKVFNSIDKSNKFCQFLIDPNTTILSEKYTEFPLNLLPELNGLNSVALFCLILLSNIYLVKYISTLDYSKYIPNNKFGYYLNIIIARYIKLWTVSSKLLIFILYFNIVVCILFSKIFFIIIAMN